MKIKKKGEVGIARVFVSQKQAQKKLQLSLKDFRRLCILKGIYPREPSHIKKANKGSSESKIFYHLKDINFLSSEPLIKKFREYKVFLRRISHAKAKRENEKAQSLIENKPVFRLDHLIKERYPTFTSALQDLDDALCLCFAFAALTQSKTARPQTIIECRRLTAEFMHYVIESHALSKVFVSIKGIYYQAEIMGEKVTWIVGHDRAVGRANEMDFSVMATFVDFYVSMLSFVNFRLYKSLGLHYPPKLQKPLTSADMDDFENSDEVSEKIYSLAVPLDRVPTSESEVVIDNFDDSDTTGTFAEKLQRAQTLKQLFSKFKFFLNREVPKEPLAFLIRSCAGTVSWDGCPISLYNEQSSLITHQIVDRPIQNYNINRVYIQPQWIFDCFNARELLPASKYAPGEMLPPHLSPFGENNIREYIEEEIEKNLKETVNDSAKKQNGEATGKAKKKFEAKTTKGMQVKVGQAYKENKQKEINQKGHNLKLREMMIAKKHRRISMCFVYT
ncbi:pescadillo like protein [Ditylenchus destructor]|uniref:Pescadillo homolog n=1 Tax=Ditylenchus destructor TaxID=166010 RepID=A0AAD4R5K5_9BILA|nr:pescadillo like protein [Ditylenchus destructor]